ncbi:MAG: metallophosphoesterase [Clostridiales bacterium]|nr:metallophosphoesterase [Clostridiales bacterium]
MLKIIKTTVNIGLEKTVRILHTTDTHLTLCDERDNERKRSLALSRKAAFSSESGSPESYLEETLEYGKKHCDLMVHTGDLIDFVSQANIDKAAKVVKMPKVLFVPGNHEYSQYVGEAWEDSAYRMNSYMEIQPRLGVDLFFTSRQVGGVNFVGVDNVYYKFEDWYISRLETEVQKGLPIVLLMHNPLFEESLYSFCMDERHEASAGIVGCDEEHLARYSEYRALQQRPDEATKCFVDYIASQPAVKAVIAGHLHFSFESRLPCGKMQYVTGGGYEGIAREITIV